MFCAICCPYRKQLMMGVLQRTAATQGDEPGVTLLWQDHFLNLSALYQWACYFNWLTKLIHDQLQCGGARQDQDHIIKQGL
jgi:hypothetical protein